jgi:hypothetical protein
MSGELEGWTDLGHDCAFKFRRDEAGQVSGIQFRFPSSDPNWPFHIGTVPFVGDHAWTVNSLDPLDISPSILCDRTPDGVHGFIRNGRWEPC